MYYFPYTNFHDINLDWIIEYIKSAKSEIEDLVNQFENLIVQTTGDSTTQVMSQNAVTMQLNFLSSRINTLNTTVEELTAKLNEDIANLAEFETETASNFSSDRNRLSTIENTLTRFYVVVSHTETENTINVSMSELLNYRTRANVRYYIHDSVNNFVRYAYEAYSPQSMVIMLQTLPFSVENAVYRATVYPTSGDISYDKIGLIAVSQSSGTSQTTVMSQRAVTDFVNTSNLPRYPRYEIQSDGGTISSGQLTILQNILNAIVVNNYSPQIYLNITTDNVTEQLYVDSANNTGYVLRNNNYIITYTTTPSATIEPVEKVFTSSATGIVRIAGGAATGYSILKLVGSDIDLTDYYIVDADISNLTEGVSSLISVSKVSGVPVILIYSNGVAFSGSWTVTCRHK
jgi:hypothetical protein